MSEFHLTEFEPLQALLDIVPLKAQRGLHVLDIEWTCLDVTKEYIAIGSNIGRVFMFDRNSNKLERLIIQNRDEVVTCVKMLQSVDFVVAAGTASGIICIFQLPSILPGRPKELHVFTVKDVHHSPIKYLTWSQNAMKLFSGDEDGVVCCTEIDYVQEQSKSYLVCKEPHEVVQLDYAHKILLISTRYRSILCFTDEDNRIVQVGQKERKSLGCYGAVFIPGVPLAKDAVVFAGRPGLRLWRAGTTGKVQSTVIFRDQLTQPHCGLTTLHDTVLGLVPGKPEDRQFGELIMYQETMIVTFHDTCLYVIDVGLGTFAAYHVSFGNIVDLAVCADEIYLLRKVTGRPVVRLAQKPDGFLMHSSMTESTTSTKSSEGDPSSPVYIMSMTATRMQQSLFGALKGIGEKISAVQEGHRVSKGEPPPWGKNGQDGVESSDDKLVRVDSAKEASPGSVPSPTVTLPKGASLEDAEENLPPGAPPIVKLDTDELLTVVIQEKLPHASIECSLGHVMDKDDTGQGRIDSYRQLPVYSSSHTPPVTIDTDSKDDDIVFSSVVRKLKKKPRKGSKERLRDRDQNLNSVASTESAEQAPGSPCSPADATVTPETATSYQERRNLTENVCSEIDFAVTGETNTGSDNTPASSNTSDLPLSTDKDRTLPSVVADSAEAPSEKHDRLHQDIMDLLDIRQMPSLSIDEQSPVQQPLPDDDTAFVSNTDTDDNRGNNLGDPPLFDRVQPVAEEVDVDPSKVNKSGTKQNISGDGLMNEPISSSPVDKLRASTIPQFQDRVNKATSENKNKLPPGFPADNHSPAPPTPTHRPKEIKISPRDKRADLYQTSDSSTEDFYSKYRADSSFSLTPSSPTDLEPSIEDETKQQSNTGRVSAEEATFSDAQFRLLNTWTEFLVPGNLHSLCVTDKHVWCVDRSERIFYSGLGSPGLVWRHVDEPGQLIAVSQLGWIVWRLYRGSIFAGTKITARAPMGLKWEETAREVASIAVDEDVAWYTKLNGDVLMQKSLSRDRPCYRSVKIACDAKLDLITCRNGVVWALTESRSILVRTGITRSRQEGVDWKPLQGKDVPTWVSDFTLGDKGVAWVIDLVGRVWFTTGVTLANPDGDGYWYQVSMSEYLMRDSDAMDVLRTVTEFPQNIVKLIQSNNGGLITAGDSGVWVCPGYKDTLHVCRGSLLGHRWELASPSGMVSSTKWHIVSASAAEDNDGVIWAQQPNGGLFCFLPSTQKPVEVTPPVADQPFTSIVATREVVWCLMPTGKVFLRRGVTSHCLYGVSWSQLDLQQLGYTHFIHLSCGTQNVWAVDKQGEVYLRIGVKPTANPYLNPAWVPVEGTTNNTMAKFVSVHTGPDDYIVWALDSRNSVYVRKGVTDAMPIGTHWAYVSGTPAERLCISEKYVYALDPEGQLLIRHGICHDNPAGDYWRKLPGIFSFLSATGRDGLWGINREGHLSKRYTHLLHRGPDSDYNSNLSHKQPIEDEWEVI